MSRAWPVKLNGRPAMRAACQVIVVVPCAKWACRWRTSGASMQPVGERDRLQQLLDVDLARAGEARAAVAHRLGGAVASARARPLGRRRGDALDRGQERREVGAAPAVQRLGQRRRVGQVLGAGLDRVDDGVAELALALLDRLDDEQPQRHARPARRAAARWR